MEMTLPVHVGSFVLPVFVSRAEFEKAVVVMCHGGPGGTKDGPANLFEKLSAELPPHGMSTARFDFRGSGNSGLPFSFCSLETMADDLRAVSKAVADNTPLILLLESLGATVGLSAGVASFAQVLLWPALDLSDTSFAKLYTSNHLARAEQGEIVELGWEKFSAAMFSSIFTTKLYDSLLKSSEPKLFIHGTADAEVPIRQSVLGARIVGEDAKLITVEGGAHGLKRETDQADAIVAIVEWLSEVSRRLQSS